MLSRQPLSPTLERRWRWLWLLLIPLCALPMLRWLGPGLPTSPRGESVAQIGYLWMLRRLWASGDALRGWNPLILAGESTVTARIYHLHASLAGISLLLGLTPESLFKGVQVLANLVGALGSYHLARKLSASRGASLVAGAAWCFFPLRVMLTIESLFAAVASASAPWLFYGYENSRRPGPAATRQALFWGVILAASLLSGPQRFLVFMAPLAVYVVLREILQPVTSRSAPASKSGLLSNRLRVALIAALVASGLALFYWLPTVIESNQLWTSRYVQSLPSTARWPVSPGVVFKLFRLRWSRGFDPAGWNMLAIFPNLAYYLGGGLCALAVVGLVGDRRWQATLPLAAMLLVSLLLAAGPAIANNPAYAILRRLPLVADTVRNGFRYLAPAGLALGVLAALGVNRLVLLASRPWLPVLIISLALALIVLDFWPITHAFGTTRSYLGPDTVAIHQTLDELPGNERVWVPFELEAPGQHYADTSYGVRYSRRADVSDNEYHTPSAPYRASLFYRPTLRGQIESLPPLDATSELILDLSNVRYMVLPLAFGHYHEALSELADREGWRIVQQHASVALLENTDVHHYAHAYAAGVTVPGLDDESVLVALEEATSHGHALVEVPRRARDDSSALALYCRTIALDDLDVLEPVQAPYVALAMARPNAGEAWVRYESEGAFLLMISETWYPHWRVYVNGQRRSLLRMNGNFLGALVTEDDTMLSPGTVEFVYRRPWYVWLAYVISLASLVITIVLLLRPQPIRLRHDA